MRAAALALAAVLAPLAAAACDYPAPPPNSGEARAQGPGITWAGFSDATDRYPHGALGDAWEPGGLRVEATLPDGTTLGPCDAAVVLPRNRVFEDLAPRLADVTGDGLTDAIVIEADSAKGAQLAIYSIRDGRLTKIAATPFIGRANRWLAPAAIADFTGDGIDDVAYVETPHIGGTLRLWSFAGEVPRQIAEHPGVSNHRFGALEMVSALRRCPRDTQPVILLPDQQWSVIVALRLEGDTFMSGSVSQQADLMTLERYAACEE
ncbi:MAG: VCBS repeat-containing protein [Pseudomonadota bacterium]